MSNLDERLICTKEAPYKPAEHLGAAPRVVHPDAKVIGDCLQGCCDRYECPNCGVRWLTEVPQ